MPGVRDVHRARRTGRHITSQCSGPSRRVSFWWFESRHGAGSATDRHYVIQQPSREKLPISYASPAHREWSRLRHATAPFSALVATIGSAVGMWWIVDAIAPPLKDVPHPEWLVVAFVTVEVVVSISLGALVERVINRGNTAA
jgi:hypothetical protein